MLHFEYTEDIWSSVITSDSTFSNKFPAMFPGMGDIELLLHTQQLLAQHCFDYTQVTIVKYMFGRRGFIP